MTYPPQGPGNYGAYQAGPGQSMPSQPMAVIGDIVVTGEAFQTPSEVFPLAEASINAMDFTQVQRKTPTWAIVLAIVGALFFLIGLLFLLVREDVVTGYVMVTVEGNGRRHVSQVPVYNAMMRNDVMSKVAYAQTLVASARTQPY